MGVSCMPWRHWVRGLCMFGAPLDKGAVPGRRKRVHFKIKELSIRGSHRKRQDTKVLDSWPQCYCLLNYYYMEMRGQFDRAGSPLPPLHESRRQNSGHQAYTDRRFSQLSFLRISDLGFGPISASTAPWTSCLICGADAIRLTWQFFWGLHKTPYAPFSRPSVIWGQVHRKRLLDPSPKRLCTANK